MRASYDRLAARYADELGAELDGKPLDRWLLERVARDARGPVLDAGCGPGHVTGFLADHGADARGAEHGSRRAYVLASKPAGSPD